MGPKPMVSIFIGPLVFGHLNSTSFSTAILMQLGSIWGANLGLCWKLFRDVLPLESRSYHEVVSASIFLRFRTPMGNKKQSFRIGFTISRARRPLSISSLRVWLPAFSLHRRKSRAFGAFHGVCDFSPSQHLRLSGGRFVCTGAGRERKP